MVRTKVTPWHAEVRPLKCVVYITRNPVTFVIHRCRDLFLLDQHVRERKHQADYKWHVHTSPATPATTTMTKDATHVTRLQPFTAGGDNFRENIETLVSYNIHTDGLQQDCLYIKQGHLMTPTTFMTYSMAIDPCKTVIVIWTPIQMYSMQQRSQPSSLPGSPLYTSS